MSLAQLVKDIARYLTKKKEDGQQAAPLNFFVSQNPKFEILNKRYLLDIVRLWN
jgi:hypothetical protein